MNNRILLGFLSIFLIFSSVSAQSLLRNWYEWINIPEDYSTFPNLLYFVIVPFLGVFAIIWGILTNLNIFKLHKVNILLSFIFAFALLYTGILLAVTFYLFQIGGLFGVLAFFVLFFALTAFYATKKTSVYYGEAKEAYEKYIEQKKEGEGEAKEVSKKRKKVTSEIEKRIRSSNRKRRQLDRELRDIQKDVDKWETKLGVLFQKHAGAHPRDKERIWNNEIRPAQRELNRVKEKRDRKETEIRAVEDYIRDLGQRQRRL